MKIVKVIVLTSFVLIVVAVSVLLNQRSEQTVTLSEKPISEEPFVEPSPTIQTEQTDKSTPLPQTQPTSSPVSGATPGLVTGHQQPTQTSPIPTDKKLTAEFPPNTVATVNNVPITKAQLDEEFNKLMISPKTHRGITPDRKENLRKLALDELVARELAYQEAKKMGLTVSEKEIAASFNRIKQRYKTAKSFSIALHAEKLTENDLKQRIERDLLLEKINKIEIEDRARVSEAEARQHYEANKSKFVIPVSVRLWNIFVKVEAGKENEAREKIEKVYKLLREGANFGEVAYKNSEDDYKIMGGDYGWVHRGQLVSELEQVAFGAKENEITEPFQANSGWNIIKVGGTRPEKQLTYQEVKEKIIKGLYQQRIRQVRIDFVSRLKAAATIKYAGGS